MTQTELLKMIGSGAVRDLDLTGRELKNIDFKGCRVENVTFDECTLTECNFDGCGMERVSFRKAVLRNCRFRRAKIAWSDFRYCEIERATFEEAEIRFCDLYRAMLTGIVIMRKARIGVSLLTHPACTHKRGGTFFLPFYRSRRPDFPSHGPDFSLFGSAFDRCGTIISCDNLATSSEVRIFVQFPAAMQGDQKPFIYQLIID